MLVVVAVAAYLLRRARPRAPRGHAPALQPHPKGEPQPRQLDQNKTERQAGGSPPFLVGGCRLMRELVWPLQPAWLLGGVAPRPREHVREVVEAAEERRELGELAARRGVHQVEQHLG